MEEGKGKGTDALTPAISTIKALSISNICIFHCPYKFFELTETNRFLKTTSFCGQFHTEEAGITITLHSAKHFENPRRNEGFLASRLYNHIRCEIAFIFKANR